MPLKRNAEVILMTTKAIYAGSFDPLTYGHLDIIRRSLQITKQLVIGVGVNSGKNTMFTEEERIQLLNTAITHGASVDFLQSTNIKVLPFRGLLVDFAKEQGADILIRGMRSVTDFEYEMNLANVNKMLAPSIQTVLLPADPNEAMVSSSAVKEIAKFGGDVSRFVPSYVAEAIIKKFGFFKTGDEEAK